MTSAWTAADAVASEMAATPYLADFRAGLAPGPGNTPGDSVHGLLLQYSMLRSQPLLLGGRLVRIPEFAGMLGGSPSVQKWLAPAQRLFQAMSHTVEFLRSRLSGYPGLLVPDLLPSAPRVHHDGFWDMRFPWPAEMRRAGLQFAGGPDVALRALDLPDGGRAFAGALGDLVSALRSTESWRAFAEAHAALAQHGREDAKALRWQYRQATTEARMDEIAGELAMRARAMRDSELDSVHAAAAGPAADYFRAFRAIDEVIDAVAALLNQRLASGRLSELRILSADWGRPAELRHVRVHAILDDFHNPYELVRVGADVDSLSGLMLLHGIRMFWADDGTDDDDIVLADGRLLVGSSDISAIGS